jgi:hypothetical protein
MNRSEHKIRAVVPALFGFETVDRYVRLRDNVLYIHHGQDKPVRCPICTTTHHRLLASWVETLAPNVPETDV